MSTDEIDRLIEQHLDLLDQYMKLREELNKVQASIFQNIARANYSAERGVRYGRDYYDERMQASRRVLITVDGKESSMPHFTVQKGLDVEQLEEAQEKPSKKATDPLRWFGLMAPQALRAAQGNATQLVETLVPRILAVDAELKEVEIRIRRARKYHARNRSITT